jgi:hypothetical protein
MPENEDWLYMQLHLFKKGIISNHDINDDLIFNVKPNGVVTLRFDTKYEFVDMLNISEDDKYLINDCLSSYHQYEFYDYNLSAEEWEGGYMFYYFSDENIKKINNILNIIKPNLRLSSNSDDLTKTNVAEALSQNFNNEISDIISSYQDNANRNVSENLLEIFEKEYCNIFEKYHIFKVTCFYKYVTTVDKLINLYETFNRKGDNLYNLLKLVIEKDSNKHFGHYYENIHEFFSGVDSEDFNNDVTRQLDKILDLTEDMDTFIDLEEYKKISNEISKYGDKWTEIPKKRGTYYKILNIDPKTNLINLEVRLLDGEILSGSMSLERFHLLLNQPELF